MGTPVRSAKFCKCPSHALGNLRHDRLQGQQRGRPRMPTLGGLLWTGRTECHWKPWQGGRLACQLWQLATVDGTTARKLREIQPKDEF